MKYPDINIRQASAFDIPEMAILLRELFEIEQDFSADFRKQEAGFCLMFSDPARAKIFVAEKEGKIIGMATAQLVVSTAEGALSALVEDVVVTASERGRGVGSMLLGSVTDWAASRMATRMQLLADKGNEAALAFYEKLGWSETRMIALRKSVEADRS